MKLELPVRVDDRKLTHYLLIKLERNDKSNYLGLAGYELTNWEQLKHDLIALAVSGEVTFEQATDYGTLYTVVGQLPGITGRRIWVKSIWMRDVDEKITKFIRLYPPPN